MKLRLLDVLACPRCSSVFRLQDTTCVPSRPSSEVSAPTQCGTCRVTESPAHSEAKVAERDCSACYEIEIQEGLLVCEQGHTFPIRGSIPRLTLESEITPESAKKAGVGTASATSRHEVGETFGAEWEHFRYDDKTWGVAVDDRCELFLQETGSTPADLQGKLVLDAGCGNGSLSRGMNRFGCEVIAADVSNSVDVAFQHFAKEGNNRTHFVQADLMHVPFRDGAFDVIYSSGVLHHNPDTRKAFDSVLGALKPGGRIYIWLYHREPGLMLAVKRVFRSLVAPLPARLNHFIVCLFLPYAMMKQYLRTLFGRIDDDERLTWRGRLIVLLDSYTCRYRWEHTQDEVHGWYREHGLVDIATTEVRKWGFGVLGHRTSEGLVKSS